VIEPSTGTDPTDRLTTGEAAKLLNCSRQHIVDLCEQGLLPYTTVGRHRRVLRSDVDAIRTRTDRLSRDERRSLWLGYATAAAIIADPDRTIAEASRQLELMRATARGQARSWLDEWQRLIAGPIDSVLAALVDRSLRGRELRQNSPFAGALDDDVRTCILSNWKRFDRGNPR
jgi:excisionase family DNA binding protein